MSFVRFVKLWIIFSALAGVAGWTLSALGMLDQTGYVLFVIAAVAAVFLVRGWSLFNPLCTARDLKKMRWRFRRFLPAGFSVLAALVFISGLLYAPNDHTGLSYRLPRVLQWLSRGHWFWINTPNYRMNDRACGIEWLSAPLLLFTNSDRALFLLNFIPFLLLPGLVFSVWTRLGVRPRAAWSWMWLLPTGYCFLIQAGGIANDSFPTAYALAMMDFALRARDKARGSSGDFDPWPPARDSAESDLGFSLLSAALMVGAKASNLPLGLPWAIVIIPLLQRLGASKGREAESGNLMLKAFIWLFLFLSAAVVSFLPTAILNTHYLHDWSGLSIEHAGMHMKSPLAGILGNGVLLLTNNFVPTFFPLAGWWNHHALSLFPTALVRLMNANFEGGFNMLGEMPTEDWVGIGFGVSVLVVVSVLAGLRYRGKLRNTQRLARLDQFALLSPWLSLLVYCMKTGMVTPARLITPYYPLLLPALLIGAGQSQVVRRCWWRILADAVLVLALAALVVNPSRPLWPARSTLSKLVVAHPRNPQLLRAQKVYEVYAHRADPLAGMRQWFPSGLKAIGFMGTDDDLDISLWKPYGSRRVEPFLVDDSPAKIHALGIEYAVVSGLNLDAQGTTLDDWLRNSGAQLLDTTNATMTVSQGPEPWYFVKFKP